MLSLWMVAPLHALGLTAFEMRQGALLTAGMDTGFTTTRPIVNIPAMDMVASELTYDHPNDPPWFA